MQGFISLHRKLMENPIWGDPNYLKLWVYCLFKATHQEHEQLLGNQMVILQRGQFVTGRNSLAEDLNKGVKPKQQVNNLTWWRYLQNLETWGMLNIKSNNKYSVVTIDKYDFYQSVFNKSEQQTEHQMNNKRTTNEQQMNTNNNVNNENNNNKTSRLKYEICDMELAELLFKKMRENNPGVKQPKLETWANEVRLMRKSDKRTVEQISYLINWTQEHYFWKTNILSITKLRKQWDQLVLKCKEDKGRKPGASKQAVRKEDFNLDE